MSGLPPAQPRHSRHPALRIGRSASEKQPKPKCSFCKRGFQFWRVPQLQIKCTDCQNFVHLRCIKTPYDEEKYICQLCSPSGVDSSVASPAPATIQCSLTKSNHSNSACDYTELEELEILSSTNKPSYRDHLTLLDSKLAPLGFTRSQLTPADGNCLIHG